MASTCSSWAMSSNKLNTQHHRPPASKVASKALHAMALGTRFVWVKELYKDKATSQRPTEALKTELNVMWLGSIESLSMQDSKATAHSHCPVFSHALMAELKLITSGDWSSRISNKKWIASCHSPSMLQTLMRMLYVTVSDSFCTSIKGSTTRSPAFAHASIAALQILRRKSHTDCRSIHSGYKSMVVLKIIQHVNSQVLMLCSQETWHLQPHYTSTLIWSSVRGSGVSTPHQSHVAICRGSFQEFA